METSMRTTTDKAMAMDMDEMAMDTINMDETAMDRISTDEAGTGKIDTDKVATGKILMEVEDVNKAAEEAAEPHLYHTSRGC